jgi:hypothetical protein
VGLFMSVMLVSPVVEPRRSPKGSLLGVKACPEGSEIHVFESIRQGDPGAEEESSLFQGRSRPVAVPDTDQPANDFEEFHVSGPHFLEE